MKPLQLKDAIKTYTRDQEKVLPPEETVKRYKEKLSRLDLDILERTERIDNGRLDIPVFFSYCGRDARAMIGNRKQMGKGATPEQAEASAVMELAERYSFFSFSRTPEKFVVDTYRNLKDRALPFDMIAKSVHDDSDDLDQARRIFESLRMKWTWAYNLTRREPVLLPFDWFYAINEFNGPSAGNCTEEALSQGICEIVERHVSSIVSREKRILPAIDPDSADDALALEMLAKYRSAGIRLFVTDFTLDMGIPTVGVLAYDPSTFPRKSEIVWTAGTTPAPQKALSRALTEVAQLAGDFNSGSNYVASGLPKLGSLEEAEFITGFQSRVRITDLPDISDDNIRVEVENLTAQLASRGFEVLTIDTTHPQLAIPAYYTIIPGAHFRERALGTSVGMFATKLTTQTLPPGEAIERLAEIEKLLPGKYYVSFYLGSCHLASGNPREGLHHFETALERQPNPEDVASIYSYMGICFKELGDYRQALAVLEKGTVCDDERTDLYNLMGFCHYKLKEHAAAIDCFKKVIALDPSSAIDYANIASNYRDLGQVENAVRYYALALEIDPAIGFARENLKTLLQRM